MTQARTSLEIGPRASRGHGWGWLRTRALELAEELAGTAPTGLPVQGAPSLTVSTTSTPAVGLMVSAVRAASATGGPVSQNGDPAGQAVSAAAGVRAPERAGRGRNSATPSELTGRELEILAAIASGQTNAQIAKELFLSAKTVMHHSTSIYRKLGVRGRAEAVALAFRNGLLRSPE